MRAIGLDWGTVRVGIAMTDEEQTMAFPLQHPLETKEAIKQIQKLSEEYTVEKIIMGLPLSLSGEEGSSAKKAKDFGEKITKNTGLEVIYIDERFSTTASTKALQQQDIKEKEGREVKDNIAAALLLQQYLDNKK